ncbi:MAG: response regulator [Chthoniobacterales bacterium]
MEMIPRQQFRIICVDDNPTIVENLADCLNHAGYDVDTARNGNRALMKISKAPYTIDLIITDLRMPGMDGFELIVQARAAGYIGPFIVYSGQIMPGDRQRLGQLGVSRVLEKPMRNAEIVGAVRQAQQGY